MTSIEAGEIRSVKYLEKISGANLYFYKFYESRIVIPSVGMLLNIFCMFGHVLCRFACIAWLDFSWIPFHNFRLISSVPIRENCSNKKKTTT